MSECCLSLVDFHQETRQERLVRLVKNLTIAIEKTVDDAAALKIMVIYLIESSSSKLLKNISMIRIKYSK